MAAKKPLPPTPSQICDRLLHTNAISVDEAHALRQAMFSTYLGERIEKVFRTPFKMDKEAMKIASDAFTQIAGAAMGRAPTSWPDFPEFQDGSPFVTFTILEHQHEPGVIWIRSNVEKAHENSLEVGARLLAHVLAVREAFATTCAFLNYLTDQNIRLCIPQADGPDADFLVDRDSSPQALFEAYVASRVSKGAGSDA